MINRMGSGGEPARRAAGRRPGVAAAAVVGLLAAAGCSGPPAPVAVPEWFGPEARWRLDAPAEQEVVLDLAVARYAREYRGLFGDGGLRAFTVPPPRRCADALAAVDTALAGRGAERRDVSSLRDGESETRWTAGGATVLVACLEGAAVREGSPGFVVVIDPE